MINRDLLEELEKVWVLSESEDALKEVNYDTIKVDHFFAVRLKTGSYTIMKRAETFDDEVLKRTESHDQTIAFLKQKS